jgi:hypothetical protein
VQTTPKPVGKRNKAEQINHAIFKEAHNDMTDMPDGNTDLYADELEKRRKLEEWRKRKKAEADDRERQRKQAELESYLQRRTQDWRDHVGIEPPVEEQRQWIREFLVGKQAEHDAEVAAKLAQLEAEHYNRL